MLELAFFSFSFDFLLLIKYAYNHILDVFFSALSCDAANKLIAL